MYVTLLILNGLAPLCALGLHEYANWLYSCCGIDILASKSRLIMYSAFRYSVGFFQLVSGIFLLIAVAKIRSFLVESGLTHACNYKSMSLHAVSFSLYSLAIVVYYAALFLLNLSYNNPNTTPEQFYQARVRFYITTIIVCYTNFAAQLCLIYIFLQFREKNDQPRELPRET